MKSTSEIRKFFDSGYLEYRQNASIDCAIFGYSEGRLQVLLVKNKIIPVWCLPGGYIRKDEGLDDASARITRERTGLKNLFLKQFKTFGDPGRSRAYGSFDPDRLFELTGFRIDDTSWLMSQTISVGFYAISDIIRANPEPDFFSSECRWFPVDDLPKLGFDHGEMVHEALLTMRMHLYHFPVGKNLLPDKFTLKDIKLLYEILSGKQLHATNFPNKLIKLGLIKKLDEKKNVGAHRAPAYYRFNNRIYEMTLRDGVVLV
jgi:8-oxo-dGTP diphosphatase